MTKDFLIKHAQELLRSGKVKETADLLDEMELIAHQQCVMCQEPAMILIGDKPYCPSHAHRILYAQPTGGITHVPGRH